MLYSYLVIMIILLILFLCIVMFTADRLARETYRAENSAASSRLTAFSESILRNLSSIEDTINRSPVFSSLYFSTMDGRTLSSGEGVDITTAIRNSYSSLMRYNVIDVALFVDGRDYAYMPGGIQELDEEFRHSSYPVSYLEYGTIASALSVSASRYSFTQPAILYLSDFSYQGGAGHGVIAISFDSRKIGEMLISLVPEGSGVALLYNGQPFISFGDISSRMEILPSPQLPRFAIGFSFPDYSFFRYSEPAAFIIPIIVGIAVFLLVLFLSIYFSKKNYRPISLMKSLIPESDEEKGDEIDSMISSLKGIIGEVSESRAALTRIRPYAEEGALHGLVVSGDDSYMELKTYYVVAAVGFDVPAGEDDVKAIIKRVVSSFSNDDIVIYSYWRNNASLFLVMTSDTERDLDNLISLIHSFISGSLSEGSSVTIGVDRWREGISFFRDSCLSALKALDYMIVRGKGDIYFAEDNESLEDAYFFPSDFELRLIKLCRARDEKGVRKIFHDMLMRNLMTYDLSASGAKQLSDEVYYTIVHIARTLFSVSSVDRAQEGMTLEESFKFYEDRLISLLVNPVPQSAENSQYDALEAYVNSNYTSPDLSQKMLCDMFGISAKSISLHYSARYGMTYLEYVTKLRIDRARELLLSPEFTIEKVAELSGYSSTLTFRRNFKDETGFTPSEYRNGILEK